VTDNRTKRSAFEHHEFSPGEEIAHAITHGIGMLGSVIGLVVLVVLATQRGDKILVASVAVFGATMVVLYSASTMYHALTSASAKRVFMLLDHAAIHLLIAGTYTPFALVTIGGTWGWSFCGVVWGLAILGIVYEVVLKRPWRWLSLAFYLMLGWLAVIALPRFVRALPPDALWLMAAGGLAYTGGAVFYAWRGFPYHHAVWHVFVLAGTAFHFLCVLLYVIPGAASGG